MLRIATTLVCYLRDYCGEPSQARCSQEGCLNAYKAQRHIGFYLQNTWCNIASTAEFNIINFEEKRRLKVIQRLYSEERIPLKKTPKRHPVNA